MMTTQADEKEGLGFWGVILVALCFFPFMYGMIFGLLLSPFIAGFSVGREMARNIAKEKFGEPSNPQH